MTSTTDIATYDPAGGTQGVVVGAHVQSFVDFAKTLAVSDLLPDGLKGKPGNVFMAIMQGLDLGLRPMQALQLIDVIKGKPCIKAEGMRALIVGAGHEIRVIELSDEKCVMEGRRKGTDVWSQASFSAEQATAAGLRGDNWTKYRPDMLFARATTRLAKAYFADVINGLSSAEELQDVAPVATRSLGEVAAARDTAAVNETTGEIADDDAIRAAVLAAETGASEPEPVDAEIVEDKCKVCGTLGPAGHDLDLHSEMNVPIDDDPQGTLA